MSDAEWKAFVSRLPEWRAESDDDDDDEQQRGESVHALESEKTVDTQSSAVVIKEVAERPNKRKFSSATGQKGKRHVRVDVLGEIMSTLGDSREKKAAFVVLSKQDRVRNNRDAVYNLDEEALIKRLRAFALPVQGTVSRKAYAKRFAMAAIVRGLHDRFKWNHARFVKESGKGNQIRLLRKLSIDGSLDLSTDQLSLEEAIMSQLIDCPPFTTVREAQIDKWKTALALLMDKLREQKSASVSAANDAVASSAAEDEVQQRSSQASVTPQYTHDTLADALHAQWSETKAERIKRLEMVWEVRSAGRLSSESK